MSNGQEFTALLRLVLVVVVLALAMLSTEGCGYDVPAPRGGACRVESLSYCVEFHREGALRCDGEGAERLVACHLGPAGSACVLDELGETWFFDRHAWSAADERLQCQRYGGRHVPLSATP